MTYKIIDGKIYQESEKTIEQLNLAINNIQAKVQSDIVGINTCENEIIKQKNQINVYIKNINDIVKAEGLDKELISLIKEPKSLPFCTYID